MSVGFSFGYREPKLADGRAKDMKRILTPLVFVMLLLAACGDNTTDVGTASGDGVDPTPTDPIPVESDGGIGDGAEPLPDLADSDPVGEHVITDTDIVSPKVTTPAEVVVNPDSPTELWVRFVGGDPNCTAASVTVVTETPDVVHVELLTGITQDALVRSCVAGEFNLRVDVALNEPVTGKNISWTEMTDGAEPELVTPDLSTDDFVGLTEAEVEAIADENLIPWRVVRVDGEDFAITMDENPGRLNLVLEGGFVTEVWLG